MNIYIAWWWIPAILVALGVLSVLTAKPTSDWDFVTPLLQTVVGIALIVVALAFCLGRWLA